MAKVPVHELRKLILPLETAVDAVLELDSEQGGSLAFGTILEAKIEGGGDPGLALVVQRRGSESTEERKFSLPILAAAFIRYCWKCRIPLPRHGSKRIEIAPDGFIFTIEGTVEVIRRHGPLPQQPLAARREARKEASADAPKEGGAGETASAGAQTAQSQPSPAQEAGVPPPEQLNQSPAPEQAVA